MQYVACKFSPKDRHTYVYSWIGPPLSAGDIVRVESRHGGEKRVTVDKIITETPHIPVKPVLGLYKPPRETSDAAY